MQKTGRPEIDDSETLAAIADFMLANAPMPFAEVVRQVVDDFSNEQSQEAAIRRLRDKFKNDEPAIVEAAKLRAHATSPAKTSIQHTALFNTPEIARFAEMGERWRMAFNTPEFARIAEIGERWRMAFNTPEIQELQAGTRQFAKQAQKAAAGIGSLNLRCRGLLGAKTRFH
ncbi:MAG: hypothetical protein ACWA49_02760 [Ruegeria sp.]